jgi:hypothetical protein
MTDMLPDMCYSWCTNTFIVLAWSKLEVWVLTAYLPLTLPTRHAHWHCARLLYLGHIKPQLVGRSSYVVICNHNMRVVKKLLFDITAVIRI